MDRRFRRAGAVGGVVAVLLFAVLLFGGRPRLAEPGYTSDFLDLQARAMMHGRFNVNARALGIEAICAEPPGPDARCPGAAFVYFGPVPSVLRMPVLAVTDRFDGRLTQPSMLVAAGVLCLALTRLLWTARSVVRADRPLGRSDVFLAALWPLAGVLGTAVWTLASTPVVYHEAILWGVALSLLAHDLVARLLLAPSTRRLLFAVAAAALAFLTRASVGAGPVIALGLVAVWAAYRSGRRRWEVRNLRHTSDPDEVVDIGDPDPLGRLWLRTAALGALTVALYVAVNLAKFGTLASLPLDRQIYSVINESRIQALSANGGSLFGLRFVPTTLLHYLRPDALRLTGWFPYVDFGSSPRVVGSAVFDTLSRSSSITASSTWLLILTAIGLVAIARRRGRAGRAFAIPLVAAAAGCLTALAIAFIAQRYLGDLLCPFWIAAAVGVWSTAQWWSRSRARQMGGLTVLCLGVLAGTIANGGLGVMQQRLYGAESPRSLAHLVQIQQRLPSVDTPAVRVLPQIPANPRTHSPSQTRLVVTSGGRCRALYVSDGASWLAAEMRSPDHTRIRVPDDDLSTTPTPLLDGITIRRRGPTVIVNAGGFDSEPGKLSTDHVDVDLFGDPSRPTLTISLDGRPRMSVDIDFPTSRPDDAVGERLAVRTPALDRLARCRGH